jgi:hypothetical protein
MGTSLGKSNDDLQEKSTSASLLNLEPGVQIETSDYLLILMI